MKTILVTGSAGFIGFHVARKLLEAGHVVIGADNFNDYYEVSLKESRNQILEGNPNYKLYRGDLANLDFVKQIFEENKIDKVCHLAAQAGVRYSLKYPYVYGESNLTAFLYLINEAKNFGVKDFVFASSSSVYGEQDKAPFSETMVTDGPISLYAATKKASELIAHSYHHLFGMNCVGLRFFTAYGPYGRPDMAMFIFTKNILEGKPIQVFNGGKMKRDFTYVDDIAEGVVKSLETTLPFEIFNIGNNQSLELTYVIKCIEKSIGKTAIKELLPIQPGDVSETHADIKKAKELLGWEPKIDIEEGVKNFVSWFKAYYPGIVSGTTMEDVAVPETTANALHPKVSVIMSVYNGALYLREAIDSILGQTFRDFEFLIVDDCSNDNSPEILAEYAKKDSRIRVITNEFNLGLTKNLNRMIREAKGEYLARFDCDDISLPARFEEQVKLLDANPSVGMTSLWADVIDDKGAYVRTIKYPTTDADLRKALIQYNPFFHPGLMVRTTAIVEAGLYDEEWKFAQDYEMYFRIAKKYQLANVPAVLLKYREAESSITGSKNRKQVGFVLKAKMKALREGQYSKWNYFHLLRHYISWIVPIKIKKFVKRVFR